MYILEQNELPGIGTRFVVVTDDRSRLTIVMHDAGPAELYVGQRDQPEGQSAPVRLTTEEARLVAAIIGRTIYRPEAIERLETHGMDIRWYVVRHDSGIAHKSLGNLARDSGVSVLCILDREGRRSMEPPEAAILDADMQVALAGPKRKVQEVIDTMDKGVRA